MIFKHTTRIFDSLRETWNGKTSRNLTGWTLVICFAVSLLLIELKRFGLLPENIAEALPRNHFYAINISFTLLLYFEVIDLVFGMSKSFSKSVGKQFQIFSLILLRQSFKELQLIDWPLTWEKLPNAFLHIFADAGAALVIFGILAVYYKSLRHQPITQSEKESCGFIETKKAIALVLLFTFNVVGCIFLAHHLLTGISHDIFGTFYTILVFSDILIVLISLNYSHSYPVVFRNSGFALATVLLRLALTAPIYLNALIGLFSAFYVLILVTLYNRFQHTT